MSPYHEMLLLNMFFQSMEITASCKSGERKFIPNCESKVRNVLICTSGIILRSQLANFSQFDPNFVIPETSVNQVRKDLACVLGVLAGFSWLLARHRFTLLMSVLAEFSLSQNDPWTFQNVTRHFRHIRQISCAFDSTSNVHPWRPDLHFPLIDSYISLPSDCHHVMSASSLIDWAQVISVRVSECAVISSQNQRNDIDQHSYWILRRYKIILSFPVTRPTHGKNPCPKKFTGSFQQKL